MSKPIRLTETEFVTLREEFEAMLRTAKISDGKLSFTKTFGVADRKAEVFVTAQAWAKMKGLVEHYDKEVAWHGVAHRHEDFSKDAYVITDILVYPQSVTGATVDMDVDEYDKWIRDNDEDERMYNIHMQGHSHVNMGVSPSSVDLQHYDEILNMLSGSGFYIFMILNKKWDKTVKVYDMKKNVFFDTADCKVTVLDPETPAGLVIGGVSEEERKAAARCVADLRIEKEVKAFVEASKEMVRNKVYTYPGKGGPYLPQNPAPAKAASPAKPAAPAKAEPPAAGKTGGAKRRGKRRGHAPAGKPAKNETYKSIYDRDYYEYDDAFGGYDWWR